MPKSNKLPPDVIKHWPEIFKDVDVRAVPLAYLDTVQIVFDDGKMWEIDIDHEKINEGEESLEDTLEEFFEEYDDVIESVNFQLNTKKVIADIKARTKLFMKKRR